MVVNQVNRVYQPTVTPVQVPQTTYVNRVMTRKVPVQSVRYVDEQVTTEVPVQSMRMVAEEQVRQVPVQTVRKVVERVENKVPVQVCKMVAEEQVRQVPVQVYKVITEERVEPVQVQVMKYVTEERTVKVPRTVEKRVPVTYTQRVPRTVVMRVPLDACGNPLPTPTSSLSAARSSPVATQAPSLASEPTPTARTYSERQATAEEPLDAGAEEVRSDWTGSDLKHIDPQEAEKAASGTQRDALRPIAEPATDAAASPATEDASAPATKKPANEQIPTPASSGEEPDAADESSYNSSRTLPASGPAVEPAMPAFDRSTLRTNEPRLVPIVMPSRDLET